MYVSNLHMKKVIEKRSHGYATTAWNVNGNPIHIL